MKIAGVAIAIAASLAVVACGHSKSGAPPAFLFSPANGTELAPARVNVSYAQDVSVVSGGEPPYRFAVTQTVGGLTISAVDSQRARISGTFSPGQEGRGLIAFRVTDSKARVADGSYALRIDPAPSGLTLGPSLLPGATRPQRYSQFINVSGGVAPITWSVSGTLPPGLTLGTSSGVTVGITGTPTTAGTFAFTVNATDASSPARSGSIAYSITVN